MSGGKRSDGARARSTVQHSARNFFLWVSLVPVALTLLSFWAAARYQDSIDWILHTNDVLVSVYEIRASVNSAASLYEFVSFTGRDAERQNYESAWRRVDEEILTLGHLTSDNPAQRSNAGQLKGAADSLHRRLDAVLSRRLDSRLNGRQLTVEELSVAVGQLDTFRSVCAKMIAEERGLLSQRVAAQRVIGTYLAVCFVLGIVSSVALLMRAYRLIVRYERQRDTAESEIRQLNSELERRVEERTNELQEANEDLVRSNKDLTQFAYVASHDLQEPLRTVASYASLLARRYEGKLDQQADHYIRFVVDGASRMQTLVRDLLAYSRVGTQALKVTTVDLSQVIATVTESLRVLIAERHAAITLDPLPSITGDAGRLSQVFQNLIGNALKFSKPDEQPKIHIGAQRVGRDWQFQVQDNGIGFDSTYAERIFVIFQRLHRVGAYPGTGIGLAICKRVVEAHGGRIWATSEAGVGSTFFFTVSPNLGRNSKDRDKSGQEALMKHEPRETTRKESPGEAENAYSSR